MRGRAGIPRLASFLAAGLCAACGADVRDGGRESWDLFHGLHANGRIEIQAAPGPAQVRAGRLAEELQESSDFEVAVRERGENNDGGAARVVVGSSAERELLALARRCGVETLPDGGFRVLGRDFTQPSATLIATFADPERRGLPLVLFLGNDAELVAAHMDAIPRPWRPELWVYSEGELELVCPLETRGTPRAESAVDFGARLRERWQDSKWVELETGFTARAKGEFDMVRWNKYMAQVLKASGRVTKWLGRGESRQIELYVYQHPEDMEHCLGTAAPGFVNPVIQRAHVLLASGLPHDGGQSVARLRARFIAGEAEAPWLEDGLAVAAAEEWWGQPLDQWMAFLDAAGLVPRVHDIVDPRAGERLSEHVLAPSRGFLFEYLIHAAGRDEIRALWAGKDFESADHEGPFRTALASIRGTGRQLRERAKRVRRETVEAPFRSGVALMDETDGGRSSYLSRDLATSLQRLAAQAPGLDAVSLTVFATVEDPRGPLVTLRPRSVHGSASDLALANAVKEARVAQLRVALALEPLAGPHGTWADGAVLTREWTKREFWAEYERLALHYALLGELNRVEIFCLGANLRGATHTEPWAEEMSEAQEKRRLDEWRALVKSVRPVFSGGLTYAARFPLEAETAGFWEELDFIGLQIYPRAAAPGVDPSDEDLQRVLRADALQAMQLGVRWNRPVLFLEVGFPSRSDSWSLPWVPRGEIDLEAQRRYYSALSAVLRQGFEYGSMLRGFYLWNWHVDPDAGGPQDGGFTPQGKPAEAELPGLFVR